MTTAQKMITWFISVVNNVVVQMHNDCYKNSKMAYTCRQFQHTFMPIEASLWQPSQTILKCEYEWAIQLFFSVHFLSTSYQVSTSFLAFTAFCSGSGECNLAWALVALCCTISLCLLCPAAFWHMVAKVFSVMQNHLAFGMHDEVIKSYLYAMFHPNAMCLI